MIVVPPQVYLDFTVQTSSCKLSIIFERGPYDPL